MLRAPSVEAEDVRQLPRERKELQKDLHQVWTSLAFSQGYRDLPGSCVLDRNLAGGAAWGCVCGNASRELARLELLELQIDAVEKHPIVSLKAPGGDELLMKVARLAQPSGNRKASTV